MATPAWGKPDVKIGAPDATGKTIPTQGLQTILSIKDNSTKLETQEGEKKELKGEGGVVLAVRRSAPTTSLTMEVFLMKEDAMPALLKTPHVSLVLTPEDPTSIGVYIPQASVSIAKQWTSEEGAGYKLTFEPVLAKEGEGIEPFYFTKNKAIFDPFTGTK